MLAAEVVSGQTADSQIGALGPGLDSFIMENTAGAVFMGSVVSGAAVYQQIGGLGPEWLFRG